MSYFNMEFVGRLGGEPVMRYTPSGQAVTSVSVAVSRDYEDKNNKGQWIKQTIWIRCTAWGKAAERLNMAAKGDKICVQESVLVFEKNGTPRIWTDQSGNARSGFEANLKTFEIVPKVHGEGSGSDAPESEPAENIDDEMPF